MKKYLVREMLHLLKGRRIPKPPGNLPFDSCIFLCYKTEYRFSVHFNCPSSYLHITKNTHVDIYIYIIYIYKVLISRTPFTLALALSGAELGSSGVPWLSVHCPPVQAQLWECCRRRSWQPQAIPGKN